MKILIDLDNTIINTPEIIINLWNKYNPERKLKYKDDIKWDFSNVLDNTDVSLKELFTMFDKEEFYDNVKWMDESKRVINSLSEEHEIIIVTKHNENRKHITDKFIKENFPKCKLIFVNSFEEKCSIPADIIIDDKLESLQGVQKYKICYGLYDWNKNWSGLWLYRWYNAKDIIDRLNFRIKRGYYEK